MRRGTYPRRVADGGSVAHPRVLLDATAVPADRGGVGRYVDALAEALVVAGTDLTVLCQDRDVERFTSARAAPAVLGAGAAVRTRGARLLWEQTELPRAARRLGAQVVHSPHYTMPLAVPVASVVTLHDATFFTDSALHLPVKSRFFRVWTLTSLRRAQVCVVPSNATRDELVRAAAADPRRVHVAPHGVDLDHFRPPTGPERAGVRRRLGLRPDEDYVAFLGSTEPRKNVPALVEGWVQASEHLAHPPVLVLAGPPGWDERVRPALAAVPARLKVVRAGYLAVSELPGLLAGAAVVAYPSLGEGFGLPVLEAMACGACVLTTRRLSLPEVGGEAVAYTGVHAGDIAASLTGLLLDPGRRAALATAAVTRASTFAWSASAVAHQAAYRRAAALHRRGR